MTDTLQVLDNQTINLRAQDTIRVMASVIDEALNGRPEDGARQIGFLLLVFPFNEADGQLHYVSNGVPSVDAARLLRDRAERLDPAVSAGN